MHVVIESILISKQSVTVDSACNVMNYNTIISTK